MAKSLQPQQNGDTMFVDPLGGVAESQAIPSNSPNSPQHQVEIDSAILVPLTVLESERRLVIGRLIELNRLLGYSPPHAGHKYR